MQVTSPFKNIWLYIVAAIICVSGFLFLYQLGTKPFWDYDEAIYANVIHDTLLSGNVLTLRSDSQPWFEKPPLYFWLSMGTDSLFHHPEFSYRLPAALSGIASIILVMLITYELSGSLAGSLIAGIVLLTTGPFLEAGRELRLDVPAIAADLFTVYAFLRGLKSPKWFLGAGAGLAVGFLFKSVIGLLSLPFIFFWLVLSWDFTWVRSRYVWMSALLFLAIFLPWHLYETVQFGGSFWQDYFLQNVLHRFGSDVIGGSTSTGNYLSFFLTFAAPWTSVFVFCLAWLVFQSKKIGTDAMRPIFTTVLATLLILGIFILASTKILDYLLPSYPFVAITLGLIASYIFSRAKGYGYVVPVFTVLFGILTAFGLWVGINYGFHLFPYIATNDLIVSEEYNAALIIKQDTQTQNVYTYQYDYLDTIAYYSGRRGIQAMSDDQVLDQPFFLVVSKPFMDSHSFPPELAAHLAVEYKGITLILYKFTP